MPTYQAIGKQFATRIIRAIARDQNQNYQTKSLIKQASKPSVANLATEILAIGRAIDTLTYGDRTPLSEKDKDAIIEEITNALGWPYPNSMRRLTKSGSVDALLALTQQLQSLFTAVKK